MSGLTLNQWGETYELFVEIDHYAMNDNLAIQLYDASEGYYEPFATLTVNLGRCAVDCALVDTNNCPWAEDLIKRYNLGKPTGEVRASGFCVYPQYKFNMDELNKYSIQDN